MVFLFKLINRLKNLNKPSKPQFKIIFYIMQKGIYLLLLGCSSHETAERDRLREQNAKGEYVYRHHDEVYSSLPAPKPRQRENYPWEEHKE